jgi:Trypsin-co-occurring domain 2
MQKEFDMTTNADAKNRLSLKEFIYQIKAELLAAQAAHAGEPAYFDLESVDLEVKVTTTFSGDGKLKLDFWVVNLGEVGGSVSRENVHTVKLSFRIPKSQTVPIRAKNWVELLKTDETHAGLEFEIPIIDVLPKPVKKGGSGFCGFEVKIANASTKETQSYCEALTSLVCEQIAAKYGIVGLKGAGR